MQAIYVYVVAKQKQEMASKDLLLQFPFRGTTKPLFTYTLLILAILF